MNKSGFTLFESIIYIAIFSIVATALVTFTLHISTARNKSYAIQSVNAQMRLAVLTITDAVKQATAVNTGASTFDTDPGVLSLQMLDASKDPTIFSLTGDNGRLQVSEGGNPAVPVTDSDLSITKFIFTNLSPVSGADSIRMVADVMYASSTGIEFFYQTSVTSTASTRL
ncbi:MAG: hypothetical protein COU35_04620 [Candidatus Magasanikbacteria bacterium CG10_big_fil_rev_8_21_14_0_10_47_10]|uniref:Type II secretion system protein n=1 Tax=Candidatus Magasanikbacteria bacterium CG10_big_fil_rev_8_21_14_0_10_47_10 TaxID=1974652 RepID=A0A2H0TPM5_9BACT|nr:MAG: hypothetical protein COU35_04620 [Candidatus Magasanikbacteria bacterium CG10_big_fil_rev_8_21_14_0_10_47_10]